MKHLGLLRNSRGVFISVVIGVLLVYHLLSNGQTKVQNEPVSGGSILAGNAVVASEMDVTNGGEGVDMPFMPKMGNETLKAELGRAAWKVLHTILARYPEDPSIREREHVSQYIDSFAQVYPCGDCARHFIKLLKRYPPQLNSRKNAAMWGCFIHNKVNERLEKPIYDCTSILDDYDCGCGEDEAGLDETREHLQSIQVESYEERVGG
ncbi:hypothetical protein CAS74_004302 [Pichia kudriavzevii]|uniref:Sulfhydryl oxidase n=1 Tax=Pichia kudriavzevii TaxID=4909 RepID=A0A099NWV8_PICKU|nr:uncharacterized protein C5L36_0A09250 [Pichia kudriavzevii]AWU74331.1 hypothetical protein C5L36_0A09250 [Pichia kudriavzevii]KGK37313.1 hypothetical protein JL09_g3515 [Pichia kudriavzevii]ONH73086.1 FAD-linked sulfhydryl oxidase ERV2 [Pichia kudriavzevii]OUT20639.1 hypothetical protein CAS74_004302 [Pichia kudriavzevii]